MKNRLHNCKNPYQGDYKKVLCVCSAGLLRSPTAALVLSGEPYNFNTRSCGLTDSALIPLDDVLVEWADEIVCMSMDQVYTIAKRTSKVIVCLDIPDHFNYREPQLVELIKQAYNERLETKEAPCAT